MSRLGTRVAVAAVVSAAVAMALPASANAASYPSVMLTVCNRYADAARDGSITVNITGLNQNGQNTKSANVSVPKNGCVTWSGIWDGRNRTDYWWKTGQRVAVWNNRIVRDGSGFRTVPRTDYRNIPQVQDGSRQVINLPVQ